MISGTAAKYVFAACLCASAVDLVVIDLVIGPLALAAEPAIPGASASASAATSTALAATGTATGTAAGAATGTPTATATGTATDASDSGSTTATRKRRRSKVVARFDSDKPIGGDEDLRALAAAMIADPSAEIVLEGHTDQRGDPDKNQTLSLERATWARTRLIELGVSASRIAVVGLGSERPLDEGDDDAAIANNRRVEARWLSGGPGPSDQAPSAEEGDK